MFAPLEEDLKKLRLQIQETVGVQPPPENDKDKNKTIEVNREYIEAAQLRKFAIKGYTRSVEQWQATYVQTALKDHKVEQMLAEHQQRIGTIRRNRSVDSIRSKQ